MPVKTINDYVFYKIVCLDDSVELCYVGSTADFNKRKQTHKHYCTNEMRKAYNRKIYQTIRENGGWENFKMVEIGKAEQLTKRQAEAIEEEYRQELKANLNSMRCYLTPEEKQEYYKEHNKKYREENTDKIKERDKKYYEKNSDKFKEYSKKYREENTDKIKKYKEENSDKIKEWKKEIITCECGCVISRDSLSRHRKTKKHLNLMSTENK